MIKNRTLCKYMMKNVSWRPVRYIYLPTNASRDGNGCNADRNSYNAMSRISHFEFLQIKVSGVGGTYDVILQYYWLLEYCIIQQRCYTKGPMNKAMRIKMSHTHQSRRLLVIQLVLGPRSFCNAANWRIRYAGSRSTCLSICQGSREGRFFVKKAPENAPCCQTIGNGRNLRVLK